MAAKGEQEQEQEQEQKQIVRGPGLRTPIDKDWGEVDFINCYAMTMAYFSMGVKGLAYLVITWTTVVLLGGFVSVLKKEDFWSLTVIVLAQTAGVFDVFLREKLSKIWYVYRGLFNRNILIFLKGLEAFVELDVSDLNLGQVVWFALKTVVFPLKTVVQALLVSIVMCPLAAVYMFGVYISACVSLWRLIEQDYGDADGSANLKPALQVLYSLAVVQGVLFSYRAYFALSEKHVVKKVSKDYGFDDDKLISDYTEETKIGCEKDPTFAKGRNLITYAVDLIKSEAPDEVISGVRILERLLALHKPEGGHENRLNRDERVRQHMLIKQLIGSTSSSRILQKLVRMLHPRCPYNLTIREKAALIVAHLAGDVHLEQFPRGIQCITSLLDQEYRVMEPYQRDWLLERFDYGSGSDDIVASYKKVYGKEPYRMSIDSYTQLAVQGLRILRKLAHDEENCRVMSNTEGLLSKITAPLSSDGLHNDHHDEWSGIAGSTVLLLLELIDAPGEAGKKLQREIFDNTQVIRTMEDTVLIKCDKCSAWLQRRAISMLLYLFFHTSAITATEQNRSCFLQILIDIFADDKKKSYTRRTAGAQLEELSSGSDSKATVILILEANVKKLTAVLLDDKDKTLRTRAADILKNLSSHYNKEDECFEKLKTGITDIMPKVLREILGYGGSTGDENQAPAEADNNKAFSPPDADIEKGVVAQDNAQDTTISAPQQKRDQQDDRRFQEALLSLCATAHNKFTSGDPDLAHQFDENAAAICLEKNDPVKTFAQLVEEAQQLLDAEKAKELAIVPAVAQSSPRDT